MEDRPTIEPATRADLRAWLVEHHATARGVWVVYPKRKHAAPGALDYEAIVLEALCFGWIDSRPGTVDERRTSLYVAPRKPRSGWAVTNKARLDLLEAEGLMAPAGLAAVQRAKADGSWSSIDAAEAAVEAPDLLDALGAVPGARANWDAFPRGERKRIIQWIEMAKRPETRAARIEETARLAALNLRANLWRPRDERGT
jgi:uncharacterized protein YdeI (YjbR/CyaY-like superfamily)